MAHYLAVESTLLEKLVSENVLRVVAPTRFMELPPTRMGPCPVD
jgi:hypothetical protein